MKDIRIRIADCAASKARVSIRSGYRSSHLNALEAEKRRNFTRNKKNHARHIWDRLDDDGYRGAMACVVHRPLRQGGRLAVLSVVDT